MERIVQDYPSHGVWKNAVVVVGGYDVWSSEFALRLSRPHFTSTSTAWEG